jgi:hypothetical protein
MPISATGEAASMITTHVEQKRTRNMCSAPYDEKKKTAMRPAPTQTPTRRRVLDTDVENKKLKTLQ